VEGILADYAIFATASADLAALGYFERSVGDQDMPSIPLVFVTPSGRVDVLKCELVTFLKAEGNQSAAEFWRYARELPLN
jgi:hypothetical protein